MLQGDLIGPSFFNYYTAFQRPSERLIEKRTGEILDLRHLKEMRISVGYDPLRDVIYDPQSKSFWKSTPFRFIPEIGYCQYWDEAMPIHTISDKYKAHGFFGSIDFRYRSPDYVTVGCKFTYSYNNSNELKRLIETTNKMVMQVDAYLSLKLYNW